MGCDIHLHVEIKVGGKWLHYNAPDIDRNYRLFTKMAGVRARDNEINPIAQPRGLPPDASETTQWEAKRWELDGHSHSYLTSAELTELRNWGLGDTFGYLCGSSLDGMMEYPTSYPPDLEDVRFVFWFDN